VPISKHGALDEHVHAQLRRLVAPWGLNRFVNEALAEKIAALEQAKLEQSMKEGYLAVRAARADLNQDWEIVDTEGWPA